MQKNSQDFSMQEALQMAKSPAGQELLGKLRQADPSQLQKIADQAATGDYKNAASQLKALLQQLGE